MFESFGSRIIKVPLNPYQAGVVVAAVKEIDDEIIASFTFAECPEGIPIPVDSMLQDARVYFIDESIIEFESNTPKHYLTLHPVGDSKLPDFKMEAKQLTDGMFSLVIIHSYKRVPVTEFFLIDALAVLVAEQKKIPWATYLRGNITMDWMRRADFQNTVLEKPLSVDGLISQLEDNQ